MTNNSNQQDRSKQQPSNPTGTPSQQKPRQDQTGKTPNPSREFRDSENR